MSIEDSVTVHNNSLPNANKITIGWNGELLVNNGQDQPLDEFVNPITPVCIRNGYASRSTPTWKRRYDLGAMTLILLSDIWGYDPDKIPGKKISGKYDWTEWETFVEDAVTDVLEEDYTSPENIYFEIWNEPDGVLENIDPIGEGFWPYDHPYTFKEHFVKTWNHACKVIKNIDSNIKVVEPGFSDAYTDDMKQYFLDELQGDNNEFQEVPDYFPDVISWHYPIIHNYSGVGTIANYLDSHNNYVDGLMFTEFDHTNLGYKLAAMRRASSDHANVLPILNAFIFDNSGAVGGTVSWDSKKPQFEPENDHLGGHKRGDWWVLKTFADMNENSSLIMKTDRGNQVEVYATTHTMYGENKIKILLGTNSDTFEGLVGVNIYDLEPDYHYDYNIYRLKSNGSDEVGAPEPVYGDVVAADSEGKLYFEVDWQKPTDCYYILILG